MAQKGIFKGNTKIAERLDLITNIQESIRLIVPKKTLKIVFNYREVLQRQGI